MEKDCSKLIKVTHIILLGPGKVERSLRKGFLSEIMYRTDYSVKGWYLAGATMLHFITLSFD